MAWHNCTTFPGEKQQETLFGPHQYSLFAAQKMNAYEEKQNTRKARYEQKSGALKNISSQNAQAAVDSLPSCGSPMIIGHHSQKNHERARRRSDQSMKKASEADKKATYYANKAEAVGKGGISSDDPQAIEKLEKKLEAAEEKQERMKAANKILRKNPEDKDSLMALGFSEKESEELIHPPRWMSSTGFPSYALTNNLSKIKQTKARLKVLKRLAQAETVEIVKDDYTLRHDREENRVMFILDGKPRSEIRTILKKYAFKWSPRRGAWVRQATANGIFSARHARKELDALEG